MDDEKYADKCVMCAKRCKQPASVEVVGCAEFELVEKDGNEDLIPPTAENKNNKEEV